jgi:hypothetical protein
LKWSVFRIIARGEILFSPLNKRRNLCRLCQE